MSGLSFRECADAICRIEGRVQDATKVHVQIRGLWQRGLLPAPLSVRGPRGCTLIDSEAIPFVQKELAVVDLGLPHRIAHRAMHAHWSATRTLAEALLDRRNLP